MCQANKRYVFEFQSNRALYVLLHDGKKLTNGVKLFCEYINYYLFTFCFIKCMTIYVL